MIGFEDENESNIVNLQAVDRSTILMFCCQAQGQGRSQSQSQKSKLDPEVG